MGYQAASPGPSGSRNCIFFPRPNGLLIEWAYLYLTQKIPKWCGNREISSQLVVGLVVVGGNLVINLLPFTSGRIDSKETKRKRRRERKPRVVDHLGELKERRLHHFYLQQSCLAIGGQGAGGLVPRQLGVLWAPASPSIHHAGLTVTSVRTFGSHHTLRNGLISPTSGRHIDSFIQYESCSFGEARVDRGERLPS